MSINIPTSHSVMHVQLENLGSPTDMQTHAAAAYVMCHIDLEVNACQRPDMYCMSTEFGVNSSSCFPLAVWT